MLDSDIIIETNTAQFKFLNSDNNSISIFFKSFPNDKLQSVQMSKGVFITMIQEFIDNPSHKKYYGTFTNPNADEKD